MCTFFCVRSFFNSCSNLLVNGDNRVVTVIGIAATVKVLRLFRLGVICKNIIIQSIVEFKFEGYGF